MKKATILRTLGITLALLFLVGTAQVVAADAYKVFAGKVVLLKRVPPTWFNTKDGFVKFLKKNQVNKLHANKDNEWDFKSMAFFKKPLGDYEVEMVFYDVSDGSSKSARIFRDSFTQYTQDRNSKSLMGQAILTRPQFDANKKYVVEVQSHGKSVATGKFETKGVTQEALDEQKRIDNEMKKMEESMKDLKKKAAEQKKKEEEAQKKKDAAAGDDLF